MGDVAQNIGQILDEVPGMASSPSGTLAAAQQTAVSPVAAAQVQDLAATGDGLDQGIQSARHGGWLSDVASGFGYAHHLLNDIPGEKLLEKDVISPVAHALSGPLNEMQHDYRFVRDVYSRHGAMAGLAATLMVGGGAALGSMADIVAGPEGTVLGGMGGAEASRLFWSDSYKATTDGAAYRLNGNPVSMGRDIASLVTGGHKGEAYNALSGVIDGAVDWFGDPALHGLNAIKEFRAGAGYLNVDHALATLDPVEREFRAAQAVNDMSKLGPVNRALEDIAKTSSAGKIADNYPSLTGLAGYLAKAPTRDAVLDVFLGAMKVPDMTMPWTGQFPTLTRIGASMRDLRNAVASDKPLAEGEDVNDVLLNTAKQGTGSLSSRMYQALTNKQPFALSSNLTEFSNRTFDPMSNAANAGVRSAATRVYGRNGARFFMDIWANPDTTLEAKKTMWKNMFTNMFIRDGVDDPAVLNELKDKIDELAAISGGEHFGSDVFGKDLSAVSPSSDMSFTAGIRNSDRGVFTFPNFQAYGDALRSAKGVKFTEHPVMALGQAPAKLVTRPILDSYINEFFKPLAIGTPASALRISGNEILTHVMANGFRPWLNGLQASLRAANDTEGLSNFRKVIKTISPGNWDKTHLDPDFQFVANKMKEDALPNPTLHSGAQQAYETNRTSSSTTVDEMLGVMRQAKPTRLQVGKTWINYGPGEPLQVFAHAADLGRWREPLGQAIIAGVRKGHRDLGLRPGDVLDTTAREHILGVASDFAEQFLRSDAAADMRKAMARSRAAGDYRREDADPIRQWAETASQAFEGSTGHPVSIADQTTRYNPTYLGAIAAKGRIDTKILERVPFTERPLSTAGRQMYPATMASGWRRLVDGTFDRVWSPMIRTLSRDPLYTAAVTKQYKYLKTFADGAVDDEHLFEIARQRGALDLMPMLHNPLEKTQFENAVRNVFPFMFAQRQQYRRFGKVLVANPAAYRRMQLINNGLHATGVVQRNPQGQDVFAYPGYGPTLGVVSKALGAVGITPSIPVPVGATGNIASLMPGANSIYPGLSPVIAIPMEAIGRLDPGFAALTNAVDPLGASKSVWQQLVPMGSVQRFIQAFEGEHDQQFASSFMTTMQWAASHDLKILDNNPEAAAMALKDPNGAIQKYGLLLAPEGADPLMRERMINHLRNWTRANYIYRGIFQFFAPAAPTERIGDPQILDMMAKLRAAPGGNGLKLMNDYFAAHPEATPYSVYQTKNVAGLGTPPSQAALNYIDQNKQFVFDHPLAAAALTPQSTDNSADIQAIYLDQLAQGVRIRKTPQEYEQDLYVKMASPAYFTALKAHQDALANLSGFQRQAENQNWTQWQNNFFATHPVFENWIKSGDRQTQRQQIVKDLVQAFQTPGLPASPMNQPVYNLLQQYAAHVNALATLQQQGNSSTLVRNEKDNWNAYLQQLGQAEPMLTPLINHVFLYITPDSAVLNG